MSTAWNLHCRTHDEICYLEWSSGSREIIELIPLMASLAELSAIHGDIVNNWRFNIDIPDVAYFARDHWECDLIPIDEYGRPYDQCIKNVRCESCHKTYPCILPREHEGECQRKKGP